MDRELIEYFDRRFEERDRRSDERFDRVDQRLDGIDRRFDGVDQRLDGIDQRLDRAEEERAELRTGVRQAQVLTEDVRSQVQAVAEGVAMNREAQRRSLEEDSRKRDQFRSFVELLYSDLSRRLRIVEGAGA